MDWKPRRRLAGDLEGEADSRNSMGKKSGSPVSFGMLELVPVFCLMVMLLVSIFFISGADLILKFRSAKQGSAAGFFEFSAASKDRLLGGLLSPSFDEKSCLSRYQSASYRKKSPHSPSPYLLKRLREYEGLHKKCGPKGNLYKKSLTQLKSNSSIRATDCNYLVWAPDGGVGNRLLSLTSSFLYALLTDRVLLIEKGHGTSDPVHDMDALVCEPFPESSWLLDPDVSLGSSIKFWAGSPQSYGYMLQHRLVSHTSQDRKNNWIPAYLLLYMRHDYTEFDQHFFCDEEQLFLQKVPWLVVMANNYFTPAIFLTPFFQKELNMLFPKKDTVVHHLGRYLLHPANDVWGLVTRSYQSYLSTAQKIVGIQIRIFDKKANDFLKISINSSQQLVDQILSCTSKNKLLPEVNLKEPFVSAAMNASKIAILMTSLSSEHADKIRTMYWEHPAANGEIVSVYQPSHEEQQQFDKIDHDAKAWAEIYLLSLSDVLVTSSFSTFGYLAQGLAGVKPWILSRPDSKAAVDPPCRRAVSMEPCFHNPPLKECKSWKRVDMGALVPHVTHCEDMTEGLKLVDQKR